MMKHLQTESSNKTAGTAVITTGSAACQSRHPGSSEIYQVKWSLNQIS